MSYRPVAAYLTHYAEVRDLSRLSVELGERIDAFVDLTRRVANDSHRTAALRSGMFDLLGGWLDAHGFDRDPARRHALLDDDIELNVQGLEVWLQRA